MGGGSSVKDGLVRLQVLHVRYKIFDCDTLKFPVTIYLL